MFLNIFNQSKLRKKKKRNEKKIIENSLKLTLIDILTSKRKLKQKKKSQKNL